MSDSTLPVSGTHHISPCSTRERRLLAYSLAAGASALGVSGAAEGQIVWSGPQDINVAQFGAVNLDLDAYGATPDILMKNYVFGGNYQGAFVNYAPGKVVGFFGNFGYATALGSGFTVDAATTAGGPFQVSLGYANNPLSQFDNANGAFIGLEFLIAGESHFGWVRVSIDNAAGTFVINDWAYNATPGAAIDTGQVPEPGSLALLAAGAFGLATFRGRRQSA